MTKYRKEKFFRKPIASEPIVEVVTSALDESALIDETPDEKEARLRSHAV